MTKPAPIEQLASPSPLAIILGTGLVPGYLLRTLEEYGCSVSLYPTESILTEKNPAEKADYFFQFGTWSSAGNNLQQYVKPKGKMLFIEGEEKEIDDRELPAGMRVFRAGDVDLWDPGKLCDQLLTHFFAAQAPPILNHRKEPLSLHRPTQTHIIASPPPEPIVPEESEAPDITPEPPQNILDLPFRDRTIVAQGTRPFPEHRRHHQPATPLSDKTPAIPEVEVINHRRLPRMIGLFLTFIGVLICIIGGILFWHVQALRTDLNDLKIHLAASDIAAVHRDIDKTQNELARLKTLVQTANTLPLPFLHTKDALEIITSSDMLLTSTDDTLTFLSRFKLQNTGAFTGQRVSTQDIARAGAKIDHTAAVLKDTKIQLENTELPFFPKDTLLSFLTNAQEQITTVQQVFPLVQELFGKEGKKTYLLLLQNPMELRPTGGFIGSLALLTIDQGAIADFKILDVYDADGQLKGHVDPPLPIRTYLNQPNWFLRDSNFDPDFSPSATWALWFLDKELGTQADGVIGVNLFFLQDILRATGPLTLEDFPGETVYANTFFEKAHAHAQTDFFPGSTQKKNFLRAVSTSLLNRLTAAKDLPMLDLLTSMKNALDQKNLLLFSKNNDSQTVFEKNGWAGRISAIRCAGPDATGCYADYVGINEANLGVNKANYFVQKSVSVQKSINTQGRIVTIITLQYQNKNPADTAYAEIYKNYLRTFVPSGSTLTGVEVNGSPLSPGQVDSNAYGTDKMSFGFLATVPAQGETTIKIAYTLPQPITAGNKAYQLFFQKQGGDKTAPLQMSFTGLPPFTMTPKNFTATPGAGATMTLSTDTAVDRVFSLAVGS